MGPPRQWTAFALALRLACGGLLVCQPVAGGESFLTAAEARHVAAGGLVIRATLDGSQRRGTVRAAIRIDAPPHVVFGMMTRCEDARHYVPHMRRCRVRDQAPDNTWQLVEHEIDFGWYAPRIKYVFRADLVADRSIDFRQVTGDFKTNEGRWDLHPADGGQQTLLLYQATIDPPSFLPNWLVRSTFRREMPQMLTELRKRCEAVPRDGPSP